MSKSERNRKEKKGVFTTWTSYKSNKQDKQIANRKFRRKSKVDIHNIDKEPLHSLKEVSNTFSFASDGLAFYSSYDNNYYQTEEEKQHYIEFFKKKRK